MTISGPEIRAERVAIIEAGQRELWRVYYGPTKVRLEVRDVRKDKQKEKR